MTDEQVFQEFSETRQTKIFQQNYAIAGYHTAVTHNTKQQNNVITCIPLEFAAYHNKIGKMPYKCE